MSRAVTLPLSLEASHPDYARHRYTLAQAADYLHVSTTFLYRLVAERGIACARQSRAKNARVFFSQKELDRYDATRVSPAVTVDARPRLVSNSAPRKWDLG